MPTILRDPEQRLEDWLRKPRSTRALINRFGLDWKTALRRANFEICYSMGWNGDGWAVYYWRTALRSSRVHKIRLAELRIDEDHARIF